MCWERLSDRWTDDVTATETHEKLVASDDEPERVKAFPEPTEEAVEVEEELARV